MSGICLQKLLINLKIISKIEDGGKLSTTSSYLELDNHNNSLMQGVLRWWYKESREKTLSNLTCIVQDCLRILKLIKASKTLEKSKDNIPPRELEIIQAFNNERNACHLTNNQLLETLYVEIKNALEGMQNLKSTYNEDITFGAKLDLQIQILQKQSKEIESLLQQKKN